MVEIDRMLRERPVRGVAMKMKVAELPLRKHALECLLRGKSAGITEDLAVKPPIVVASLYEETRALAQEILESSRDMKDAKTRLAAQREARETLALAAEILENERGPALPRPTRREVTPADGPAVEASAERALVAMPGSRRAQLRQLAQQLALGHSAGPAPRIHEDDEDELCDGHEDDEIDPGPELPMPGELPDVNADEEDPHERSQSTLEAIRGIPARDPEPGRDR